MKEKIEETLNKITKAKSVAEIFDMLGLSSVEDETELEEAIRALVEEGVLHETRKHEYLLMKNCTSLKVGKIQINKAGNGFVDVVDHDDIFVKAEN